MISKEEASCLFYCKSFEEGNITTCMQNIEESPDVDLCYINNPDEPMLICKSRIFGSRVYKLYKLKRELEDEAAKSEDKEGVTLAPRGFSQWLNKNNVDLTSTKPERKITKTSTEIRARSRQLNVLHDISYVSVAEDILKVQDF
ncbi:hypothetical protein G6F56_010861 [Rhizopus delemar]|nr:hypothetical protein G6F56_010861 [Rhizopus delemar]